jgi:hypothetical protein
MRVEPSPVELVPLEKKVAGTGLLFPQVKMQGEGIVCEKCTLTRHQNY